MLQEMFAKKQGFKLVCGAGNEDTNEIKKLVGIYSLAGCNFFDVCANPDVIDAAKRGLEKTTGLNNKYICVSVGIEGDPHITKAKINNTSCINCQNCISTCNQNAIYIENNLVKINEKRCIGCANCTQICPNKAIDIYTKEQNYKEILPNIISKRIDCIEFHAISKNKKDVLEKWNLLNELYNGLLCISVDRSTSGDKELVELVKEMVNMRKPFTTIIQADGVAMSGNDDEYGTTLQAVATAQMFQNASLDAYIMISGGTNTKTMQLSKLCSVRPHCIAVGSYARKIVRKYLNMNDILENQKELNEAVKIAKNLVDISLENMRD